MKLSFLTSHRRTLGAVLLLPVLSILLSSCRTTEGFGEDLQKVGRKIENEAERRG